MTMDLQEMFGEPISVYTRAQAIEDGVLADVTGWSREVGFTCSTVMTAKLWGAVEQCPAGQDVRGRAHDVLWMAALALRRQLKNGGADCLFDVLLRVGRSQKQTLRVVADGDGVTIGFADDEW